MEITGYRGRRSRSTPLLQATSYDPKRKPPLRHSISLATRAMLLLLLILAIWVAIHRATRRAAPDSKASGGGSVSTAHRNTADGDGATQQLPPLNAAAEAAREAHAESLVKVRVEQAMRIAPQYRGTGKVETFPHFSNANRLLLTTHSRLLWYRYDTDELQVLHEEKGVYYGAFPGSERGILGEPTSLWVVSRPHSWHHAASQEWLLHLDMETGRELGRVQIDSKWAHDAVRRRDRVYVCSTGEGTVLELAYPNMTTIRELPLFTLREHVNTLAPAVDGKLWGVLHNLGSSSLVQIDLATGKELLRLPNIGEKAHGLVFWGTFVLTLDSHGGALLQVDPADGGVTQLWHMSDSGKFFKGLSVVDDIAFFGIAPRTERGRRNDPSITCELAAFDLRTRLLLWRRQMPTKGLLNIVAAPHLAVESTTYAINTADLISYRGKKAYAEALEAVHKWQLQQEHEAQGVQKVQPYDAGAGDATGQGQAAQQGGGGVAAQAQAVQGGGVTQQAQRVQQGAAAGGGVAQQHVEQQGMQQQGDVHTQQQQAQPQQQAWGNVGHMVNDRRALIDVDSVGANDPLAQYLPVLDSVHWSSGLPRLLLGTKDREYGLRAGAQLQLFRTDTSELRATLQAMPDTDWDEGTQRVSNAWIEGRGKVLDTFKPRVKSIVLIFSDQDGGSVYRFPWYGRFRQWVEPWLLQILGRGDLDKIMRLQLAFMPPGAEIERHMDNGGYAAIGHRIHVVVQSNPGVTLHVCDSQMAVAEAVDGDAGDPPRCLPIHVEEGLAFELNQLLHPVRNGGDQPCIHLIIDVAETPREQRMLRVGQVCSNRGAKIVCPQPGQDDAEVPIGGDTLKRRRWRATC